MHRPEEQMDIQSEWIFVSVMMHLPQELAQPRNQALRSGFCLQSCETKSRTESMGSRLELASLHNPHYPHPSQRPQKGFALLHDITTVRSRLVILFTYWKMCINKLQGSSKHLCHYSKCLNDKNLLSSQIFLDITLQQKAISLQVTLRTTCLCRLTVFASCKISFHNFIIGYKKV